jgi:hypothetical protein
MHRVAEAAKNGERVVSLCPRIHESGKARCARTYPLHPFSGIARIHVLPAGPVRAPWHPEHVVGDSRGHVHSPHEENESTVQTAQRGLGSVPCLVQVEGGAQIVARLKGSLDPLKK